MRRFAAVLLACVTAVLTVLALASPAQAAPSQEQYVAITSYGDLYSASYWVDQPLGIVGCARCSWWFDFRKSTALRAPTEQAVYGSIIGGLSALSDASVTTDPQTAQALRARALSQFTDAARALGRTTVGQGPVGYYDPARRSTVQTGAAWLAAADGNIAAGLTNLQTSFSKPQPQPWVTAATANFDTAFRQISTKRAS